MGDVSRCRWLALFLLHASLLITILSPKQTMPPIPVEQKSIYEHQLASIPFPKAIYGTTRDVNNLEKREAKCIESCKLLNPSHTHKLFSDDDMRAFIHQHFPHMLALYDGLENQVMRTDM